MTRNPALDRLRVKASTQHGRDAERRAAKRMGAREHPGSGNLSLKADMTLGVFKIENKATIHKSMKLQLEWLLKVSQEALETGEIPALALQFVDQQGKPVKQGDWVMIRESVFTQLVENMDTDEIC